jgi:hypothetical protein
MVGDVSHHPHVARSRTRICICRPLIRPSSNLHYLEWKIRPAPGPAPASALFSIHPTPSSLHVYFRGRVGSGSPFFSCRTGLSCPSLPAPSHYFHIDKGIQTHTHISCSMSSLSRSKSLSFFGKRVQCLQEQRGLIVEKSHWKI